MRYLNPTRPEHMTDSSGRPYFLWDSDLSLDEFRERLRSEEPGVRGYYLGKLLRQAKPDDAFLFVTLEEIDRDWNEIERYLGKSRGFWEWVVAQCLERQNGE